MAIGVYQPSFDPADASPGPKHCDNGCGTETRTGAEYHLAYGLKSARINTLHVRRFCSPECRDAWHQSGGPDTNASGAVAYHYCACRGWAHSAPAHPTLPPCPDCGTGAVMALDHGIFPVHTPDTSHLLVRPCVGCGLPHSTPEAHHDPDRACCADGPCPCTHCHGVGIQEIGPPLWCSHDEPHASAGWAFDRDIVIAVMEHDPGTPVAPGHTHWRMPDPVGNVLRHSPKLRELHKAGCPHDLNDWFSAPIAPADHTALRADFAAWLKAKREGRAS